MTTAEPVPCISSLKKLKSYLMNAMNINEEVIENIVNAIGIMEFIIF